MDHRKDFGRFFFIYPYSQGSQIPIEIYQKNILSAYGKTCGGGDLENRYGEGSGFDQPSAYCDGLDHFYCHTLNYLIEHGYPKQHIIEKLECKL